MIQERQRAMSDCEIRSGLARADRNQVFNFGDRRTRETVIVSVSEGRNLQFWGMRIPALPNLSVEQRPVGDVVVQTAGNNIENNRAIVNELHARDVDPHLRHRVEDVVGGGQVLWIV